MTPLLFFVWGWICGILLVVMWILFGIETLLQIIRVFNVVFAYVPFLSPLTSRQTQKRLEERYRYAGPRGSTGSSGTFSGSGGGLGDHTQQGLEGITGSTKEATAIRLVSTCIMTYYRPDGSTGIPVECRIALEDNVVTVYEMIRTGGSVINGIVDGRAEAAKKLPDGEADGGAGGGSSRRRSRSKKGAEDAGTTGGGRSGTSVSTAEHRKGRIDLRRTAVAELKLGSKSKRGNNEAVDASPPREAAAEHETALYASNIKWKSSFWNAGDLASGDDKEKSEAAAKSSGSGAGQNCSAAGTTAAATSGNGNSGGSNGNGGAASHFTGRVLLWRSVDGLPLFSSSAEFTMAQRLQRRRQSNRPTSSSLPMTSKGRDLRPMGVDLDGRMTSPKGVGDSSDANNMQTWSCVIMKFHRSRDNERWLNLLAGLQEARAWNDFAQTMPNPDALNLILSRFLFQNMRLPGLVQLIKRGIRKKLKELPQKKFPRDLGGEIFLDEFLLGTQVPWVSDVSEPTLSANGEVGFDFNLLYKGGEGGLSLFFRLALTYCGIRIPHVVFSIKLLELEATVHVSVGPPPSKKFWIGGHRPPVLRLEVRQGCASGKGALHRVLTSLPDLSGILTNLLKLYLLSDMVLPYMDDFPLPSVVKSPKGSPKKDSRVRTFDRRRAAEISGAPVRRTDVLSSSMSSIYGRAGVADGSASFRGQSSAGHPLSETAQNGSGDTTATTANTNLASTSRELQSGTLRSRPPLPPTGSGAYSLESGSTVPVPSGTINGTSSSFQQPMLGSPSFPSLPCPSVNGGGLSMTTGLLSTKGGDTPSGTGSQLHLSVAEESESEQISTSSTTRKPKGRRTTSRNLRDLLKLKGKDMSRESVSKTKKK